VEAGKPTVLFVCVHNAGRSQMAAAWLEHLARDRVRVLSGGTTPASAINPVAVAAMAEVSIDLSGRTPHPWTEADLHSADVRGLEGGRPPGSTHRGSTPHPRRHRAASARVAR
jgi:arsenate reductase